MQTRAHGSLVSEDWATSGVDSDRLAQGAVCGVPQAAGPPTPPSNMADIFAEELDFNALATDVAAALYKFLVE